MVGPEAALALDRWLAKHPLNPGVGVMRQLGGWQRPIPQTCGAGAAEERALALGLQRPVLDLIGSRGKGESRTR